MDTTAERSIAVGDTTAANNKKANSKIDKRKHKPWVAALLSTALPGAGQVYNKKYWKLPIVYAGIGGIGYAVYYTATQFTGYRDAYRLDIDEDPATDGSFQGITSTAVLKEYRDDAKRNLDASAICLGIWYILNIVDASVDAHLFDWNMNENLSAGWQPVIQPLPSGQTAIGIGMQFRFGSGQAQRVTY